MKAYRSSTPFIRTTTPKGREIQFVGGYFQTSDPELIEYLDTFNTQSGSMITEAKEIMGDGLTPMEQIKKKAIEEFIAQQQASQVPQDRGVSDNKLSVGTTLDLPGASGGDKIKVGIK